MFAFNVGCFERAWTFTAAACRVYECLPFSNSSVELSETLPAAQSDTKHAVELCYILEKTISQTMDRALSFAPGRTLETFRSEATNGPAAWLCHHANTT